MREPDFAPHEIEWSASKSGRLWNYYAKSPHHRNKYFGRKAGRQVVAFMRRKGLLARATQILDFSCGKGDLIALLSKHLSQEQSIVGIDVSAESIEATTLRNAGNPKFSGAYRVEVWPCALANGSQDLVLATEVIEHLTDDEVASALQECRRLLRPGGRLFLTTPNDEMLDAEKTLCPECGCIFHRWQHIQSWTRARLSNCLMDNGFTVDECQGIVWGPWAVRLYYWLTQSKENGLYAIATVAHR